jgi:hypothetical protein
MPAPGPFNDSITLTIGSDQAATIFWSTDGSDPRETSRGRQEAFAPASITLTTTSSLRIFASHNGKDSALFEGTWTRAGGAPGRISGRVVFGGFCAGKELGITRNGQLLRLGPAPMTSNFVPFRFDGVMSGNSRLVAICDRNNDGALQSFVDYSGDAVTVSLDLADPFRASAEGVEVFVGSSAKGLGTLRGTILLPKAPAFQNLSLSVLPANTLSGGGAGLNIQTLLAQLQNGYRIGTSQQQTEYPYVITDLMPGRLLPVASLLGLGGGGFAVNLVTNPLSLPLIEADKETVQDFSFGPVSLTGTVIATASTTGLGLVAARITSLTDGIQAVLMPVFFVPDSTTMTARATYSASSLKANQTVAVRVFPNGTQAITEALTWVLNPFGGLPPHATIPIATSDVSRDIMVP